MNNETRLVQFPTTGPISPADLYARILPQLQRNTLTYVHGSISGGDAVRNTAWTVEERISHNRTYALSLVDALMATKQLPKGGIITAHAMPPQKMTTKEGSVVRWRESDYLAFWMAVIGRFPTKDKVTALHYFLHESGKVDMEIMNDYTQLPEKRAKEYDNFTQVVIDMLPDLAGNAIQLMIATPGSSVSLGSMVEKNVGKALGIPMSQIRVDRDKSIATDQPYVDSLLFQWLCQNEASCSQVFHPGITPISIYPTTSGSAV